MVILEKSNSILSYHLDINFFEKNKDVTCETHSGYSWQKSEDESATFIYNYTFYAKNKKSSALFIELKSRYSLKVKIEDEFLDAEEVLLHMQDFHKEMSLFIQKNSLIFFPRLHTWLFEITDNGKEAMRGGIRRLNNGKKYEDLSDLEHRQIQDLSDMQLDIQRNIKTKLT